MSDDIKSNDSVKIPDDLNQKLQALKNVVNAHELLSLSSFPGSHAERIFVALQFLTALHDQLLKEARQHDSAHLVEGLLETSPK